MKDAETAAEMLKPYNANAMSCYPISTRINHVANDDEECAARVEDCQECPFCTLCIAGLCLNL
jgi:putative SOS response-associated peptidase YedK